MNNLDIENLNNSNNIPSKDNPQIQNKSTDSIKIELEYNNNLKDT